MKVQVMRNQLKLNVIAAAAAALLAGCTSLQQDVENVRSKAEQAAAAEMARAEQPAQVVSSTDGAWLLGDTVEVEAPQSPLLERQVTYSPSRRVTLIEIAEYVQQVTGIKVEAIDLQGAGQAKAPGAPATPGAAAQGSNGQAANPAEKPFAISYEGNVAGLLDLATSKAGIWWKLENGRLRYYDTETRTFELPFTSRVSTGNAQISASTGEGQSGGGGGAPGGGSGGAGGAGQSSSSSGLTSSGSAYSVDKWAELKEAAKVISGGAAIAGGSSTGTISVTGTPAQVRRVADWVKTLTENASQMVAITIRMYSVKLTGEDNYGWSPDLVFKGLKTQYGFSLTGPSGAALSAGTSPMSFTASVLPSATGSKAQYAGSQAAISALSKAGEVHEIMSRTVVTMNGEPAPVQVANQRSYVSSQTAPASVPTGTVPPAPTLSTSTITTGFTAVFVPRVSSGKIFMAMNITDSKLLSLDKAGEGNLLQNPNVDLNSLQNSVRLTPGDTLLLTGHQQQNGSADSSGVGSARNYMLGGGVDRTTGKQMIAIIVSAEVL